MDTTNNYKGIGARLLFAEFVEEVGQQFEMDQPGYSKDRDCED